MNIKIFFLGCAVVCFLIRGFGVKTGQIDLMNIGFAFVVASFLVP